MCIRDSLSLIEVKIDATDGVQHFSTQVELDVDIFCGANELVVFHDIPSLLQMVLRIGRDVYKRQVVALANLGASLTQVFASADRVLDLSLIHI